MRRVFWKKKHRVFPVLLFLFLDCGPRFQTLEFQGHTMGTSYSVKLVAPKNTDAKTLAQEIFATLEQVDHLMSNWLPDSEINRFNRHRETTPFSLSPATATVISEALRVARLTGGALDITAGPLIDRWGFGAKADQPIPEQEELEQLLQQCGFHHLYMEGQTARKDIPELQVNLSSLAKGYAVDLAAEMLEKKGFADFMIEVGGEVVVKGLKDQKTPWRIAIQAPNARYRPEIYKIAQPGDKAMATSGDYRNFFIHEGRRYSHILDPRTGRPVPPTIASATVLADGCMTADALATAFMILPPEESIAIAARSPGVECLLLIREGEGLRELQSPGMSAYLTPP